MSFCSVDFQLFEKWKVGLVTSARPDVLDPIADLHGRCSRFLIQKLGAWHAQDFNGILKLIFEYIVRQIVGGVASVGGYINDEEWLAAVFGQGNVPRFFEVRL